MTSSISDQVCEAAAAAGTRPYRVRLAASDRDLQSAQSLRFAVFNLELREGLSGSYATGRDADPFDAVCEHLIVEDLRDGAVVGTYRMQSGTQAAGGLGYYSAREFDLRGFEPWRQQVLELGRACELLDADLGSVLCHRSAHRQVAHGKFVWAEGGCSFHFALYLVSLLFFHF